MGAPQALGNFNPVWQWSKGIHVAGRSVEHECPHSRFQSKFLHSRSHTLPLLGSVSDSYLLENTNSFPSGSLNFAIVPQTSFLGSAASLTPRDCNASAVA